MSRAAARAVRSDINLLICDLTLRGGLVVPG